MISKVLLWFLAILLTVVALSGNPQGLMFPLFIVSYLLREPLRRLVSQLPLWAAFILSGLIAGLLVEIFAILSNIHKLPADRVLLHPTPAVDLLIAVFWYGGFVLTWYLFLRKRAFSRKAIYFFSTLYGLCTEAGGIFLLTFFANPLLSLIVTAAYAIFPLIAYMLTESLFPPRPLPRIRDYVYLILAFVLYWAIIGNVIYTPLLHIFPKGF